MRSKKDLVAIFKQYLLHCVKGSEIDFEKEQEMGSSGI